MTWKERLLVLDAISNRIAPALLALAVFYLCCAGLSGCRRAFTGPEHPSDEDMIRNFRAHREEFGRLVELIEAETEFAGIGPKDAYGHGGCQCVGGGGTGPEDPRCAEYLRLFEALGVTAWNYLDVREPIEIIASCVGWVFRGSCKGYLYWTDPPRGAANGLRHIEGPWYIYVLQE